MGQVISEEVDNIITRSYTYSAWGERLSMTKKTAQGSETSYYLNNTDVDVEMLLFDDFNQARNKALDLTEDFIGGDSIPYVGTMEKSYGYGKIIGRQSPNKRTRWRVDWDPEKGAHINVQLIEDKKIA